MDKVKIKTKPSEITKAILPVKGKRFYFDDPNDKHNWREYLLPIYDGLHQNIVLKTARQVEKSTMLKNRHITYSTLYDFFRSLYVAPTGKQVKNFSNDRLKKTIDSSELIKKYYTDNQTTDQVYEKGFTNESTIFLRSVYRSPDSVRGISADMVNIDEYQDIISEAIPVIKEVMTTSEHELFMATGTPKTLDNHLEKLWQESTQNIWLIPCKNCGTHNRLDKDPDGVVSKHGLICKKCSSSISTKDGFWYSLNPESRFAGYHISQLQTGRIQRKKKWQTFYHEKFLKYKRSKLMNEVYGLSYDNADKPISINDLQRIAKGEWMETLDFNITRKCQLYMGVDWGENKGSFNVAVVGGFKDNTFQIFYIKKFDHKESADPDYIIQRLSKIFDDFKCTIMVCDHGAGHKENLRLQKILGRDKVWEIYHSANKKRTWDWDENRSMYVVNRSKAMANVIFPIQNENMIIPKWKYMKKEVGEQRGLYEDFTSLTAEYSERLRRIKYDHDSPDDIMQATVYSKFGAHINENRDFVG